MPFYFAYGPNMDVAAMQARCPRSRMMGFGRLARYKFIIMQNGYGSVAPDPLRNVHGVLWDLALADMRALEACENPGGLYKKIQQPVLREGGGSARALVYVGQTLTQGAPLPGYMESVVGAARIAGLPEAYLRELTALAPSSFREGLKNKAPKRPQDTPANERQNPKVRPRFATPLDRS